MGMTDGERATVSPADDAVARRLRLALEMHTLGVAMMREKLRRDRPDASEAEISAQVGAWLRHRPGAEDGDTAPGVLRSGRRFDGTAPTPGVPLPGARFDGTAPTPGVPPPGARFDGTTATATKSRAM